MHFMSSHPDIQSEIEAQKHRGVLLIISGASGAGKDTIMKALLEKSSNSIKLVTTNSRPKRDDEVEGYDYHFVSKDEFEKLISEDAFFEWVEYRGHYRGSQKRHVQDSLESGKDVIWRIDVRGVKNIRDKVKVLFPRSAFVLLAVNNLDTLKERMITRASETKQELNWSLDMAIWEQNQFPDFDYVAVNENGDLDLTINKVIQIIEATRMKVIVE